MYFYLEPLGKDGLIGRLVGHVLQASQTRNTGTQPHRPENIISV